MNTKGRFLDTYLDSPILAVERDQILYDLRRLDGDYASIKSRGYRQNLEHLSRAVNGRSLMPLEPFEYEGILDSMVLTDLSGEILTAWKDATSVTNVLIRGLIEWGIPSSRAEALVPRSPIEGSIPMFYTHMRFYEGYLNKLTNSRAVGSRVMIEYEVDGNTLTGNEYVVLLSLSGSDVVYLASHSQILMIKDMLYGRFNACLACLWVHDSYDLLITVQRLLQWFLKCLTTYGNRGYQVGKYIEALTKTNLIRKSDPVFGGDGSHQAMLTVARSKESIISGESSPLIDELELILCQARPLYEDVELFGLQKLSGHPIVNPEAGGKKVRENARVKVNYHPSHISRVRNNFCRMYTEGYIRKKSAWPPLDFRNAQGGSSLHRLYTLNELNITPFSYPLSDWNNVRFKKNQEFNYFPNFTDLMDDKSISLYRDEFTATWDKSKKTRSHKRLLLEMLSRPEISIKQIVNRVCSGDIPFSWLIVSLYPKEREFKEEPRLFGMMVFEMRAFFTATEANLAESIFPCLPPQTMTLTKIETQELFFNVTQSRDDETYVKLYNEFDLAGWNGRFHAEVVDPIGQDIEDIFDMPGCYSVIHHFFDKSIMSLRLRDCKPLYAHRAEVPGMFTRFFESDLLWPEHSAGIEGLCQKLWTCPTYSMFDLAMQTYGLKYHLIGQADNQISVADVPIPVGQDIQSYLVQIADNIDKEAQKECNQLNHELNLDECIHSTEVLTYSKDVYIGGSDYHTSVKALSRVFPHSASDFPSVYNSVSAITGQCLAAAERVKDPYRLYGVALFHVSLYLRGLKKRLPVESLYLTKTTLSKLTSNMVRTLLMYPGELGGLPIPHYMGFLYKGGDDPLGKALASLKLMGDGSPLARRVIFSLHKGRWMDKKPLLSRLLDDPYSLPLLSTSSPETQIFRQSLAKVTSYSKNKDLKELVSLEVKNYDTRIREELLKSSPLNPVLLSDILGWSIVGLQRSAMKMFTSTQTIQGLLQSDEEANPCTQILLTGSTQFLSLIYRLSRMEGPEMRIKSVFEECTHLRNFWVTGSKNKIVGVTGYTPLDFTISLEEPPDQLSGFKVTLVDYQDKNPKYERGPEPPYRGRPTREKRSEHGYKITTSSEPERAIKRLSDIITQPGLSDEMCRLISNVAETRGDISLVDSLPLLSHVFGGTIGHRYQSRLGGMSANLLGTETIASHCILSTDTAPPFSGGEEDYPIFIQKIMVALIGLMNLLYPGDEGKVTLTLITSGQSYKALGDEEIYVNDLHLPLPPSYRHNPLVYASEVFLERQISQEDLPGVTKLSVGKNLRPIALSGLGRVIRRSLSESHSAAAVADKGSGLIHLTLELSEIKGCGVAALLTLCSTEIARYAIDALYSRSVDSLRWTPTPVIMSLSLGLGISISRYLKHRYLQDDPFLLKSIPPSCLRYSSGGRDLSHHISDLISSKALQWFNLPTSPVYTHPVILFQDEPEGEVWRCFCQIIKRIITQAIIVEGFPIYRGYQLLRRNLTVAIMSSRTEEGRVGMIIRLCHNVRLWLIQRGCPIAASRLTDLIEGREIYRIGISCYEASRLFRDLSVVTIITSLQGNLQEARITPLVIECTQLTRDPCDVPLPSPQWSYPHNRVQWDMFNYHRLKGRVYGGDSSVAYSYGALGLCLPTKEVLIVGCGLGSGAACLISIGIPRVYGLDLHSDIDPRCWLDGNLTPPVILSLQMETQFDRVRTHGDYDSDIFQTATQLLIRSYLGRSGILLVDIPIRNRLMALHLLTACKNIRTGGLCGIRLIMHIACIEDMVGCIYQECSHIQLIPIFSKDGIAEVWILFTVGDAEFSGSARVPLPDIDNCRQQWIPTQIASIGGIEYLRTLLLAGYAKITIGEYEASALALERMLGASIGISSHRFTYHQWTQLIESWISFLILIDPARDSVIETVIQQSMTTIVIAGHTVPINVTLHLRRKLTRVLPRLINV